MAIYECNQPGVVVALTFDDGPSPATIDVLDTLKAKAAVATFYLIGNMFNGVIGPISRTDIVTRAYDEGHMIAIELFDHILQEVRSRSSPP